MLTQIQPLGLLNVSTYLSKNGHDVRMLFLPLSRLETEKEISEILGLVGSIKPDIVGFSLMTFNFQRSAALSKRIKDGFPDILIIWGGIHPTLMPAECLDYADAVCLGEAEEAMLELLDRLENGRDHHGTRNFWFRKENSVIKNELRPYRADLDSLPFPQWDWDKTYCIDKGRVSRLDFRRYCDHSFGRGSKYNVLFSRGCEFNCIYCCNSYFKKLYDGKGNHIRKRNMDGIMEELLYIKKNFSFVELISIQDDNFLMSDDDFLDVFAAGYKRHINLPFTCKSFPNSVTAQRISKLKQAGLEYLQLGVQASDAVNKNIFKRPSSLKDVLAAGKILREYGMVGRYDVIVDNPYETEKGVLDILDTLIKLPRPYWLQSFPMAFFPSTELAERAKKDGFFTEEKSGYRFEYGRPRKTYLNILISAVPRTPRWLAKLFLIHRNKMWMRALFIFYVTFFAMNIDRFIFKLAITRPLLAMKLRRAFNIRQFNRKIYQGG